MKKLLSIFMVLLITFNLSAKCEWSGVKVKQNTQWRSYYKFIADGLDSDSCTEFFWMFTYRNAKGQLLTDTFAYNNPIAEFEINLKGDFKLRLKAINYCDKCDTTWTFYLQQVTFPNANWGYGMKDCKRFIFESNKITNQKEECVQVYWYIYDNVGNEVHVDSGYRMDYTFPWEGKFEVYCQWWNKCLQQDTFWGRDFDIYCDSTLGLKPITPSIGGMVRPNPASCEFYITDTRVPMEYMILNTSGTVIAVGNTSPFEQIKIESCNWPNGVYYLWIMGYGRELIMVQH